jgi:hypothetical protein
MIRAIQKKRTDVTPIKRSKTIAMIRFSIASSASFYYLFQLTDDACREEAKLDRR